MTDDSEPRDTITVTYVGPPAAVGFLAQLLEKQGISVQYDPPTEYRDNFVREVAVQLTADGTLAALIAGGRYAAAELRRRFPGARVDGVPGDSETSGPDFPGTTPGDAGGQSSGSAPNPR